MQSTDIISDILALLVVLTLLAGRTQAGMKEENCQEFVPRRREVGGKNRVRAY